MENENNLRLGSDFLRLRKLLKISQKDFAKLSVMSQEDLQDFEQNSANNLTVKRIKICVALNKLLEYYHDSYPEIIVNQIVLAIKKINPFSTLDELLELDMLIQNVNKSIAEFNRQHYRK